MRPSISNFISFIMIGLGLQSRDEKNSHDPMIQPSSSGSESNTKTPGVTTAPTSTSTVVPFDDTSGSKILASQVFNIAAQVPQSDWAVIAFFGLQATEGSPVLRMHRYMIGNDVNLDVAAQVICKMVVYERERRAFEQEIDHVNSTKH